MFHDPALERTTDSTGQIKERKWYGHDGMEQVRTKKEPKQPIPTFSETVALLMQPENRHVKFNVDVKVQNDPDRLFSLMDKIISTHPDWKRCWRRGFCLGSGILGFSSMPRSVCRIAADPISGIARVSHANTFGTIVRRSRSRLAH